MNFLAHSYLSGNDEEVIVGNFMGDFVKGRKYLNYPKNIQRGIILHRKIDAIADKNPEFVQITKLFKPVYDRYATVVTDIVNDYYLAKNWEKYSPISLKAYCFTFYSIITRFYELYPTKLKQLIPFMIFNNWLESYAELPFIKRVLKGMAKRTSLPYKAEEAISCIKYNNIKMQELSLMGFNRIIKDLTHNYSYKNK